MIAKPHAIRFVLQAYKPSSYQDKDIIPLLNGHFADLQSDPKNGEIRANLEPVCRFVIDTNIDLIRPTRRRRHHTEDFFRDDVVGRMVEVSAWLKNCCLL